MPTYITLLKMTPEGAREIKGLPGRYDDFRRNLENAGGRLIGAYAVMGEFDYVAIFDVPDDTTAVSLALKIAQKGTSMTRTMRAFPMDEFVRIVGAL
ncbi:MAG TPA: GYD domain-containing protein [Thermodesulfobacteriota bacterium]|nr:GYD domain-containing protein [Thermodesulfobacteriota bacterium]